MAIHLLKDTGHLQHPCMQGGGGGGWVCRICTCTSMGWSLPWTPPPPHYCPPCYRGGGGVKTGTGVHSWNTHGFRGPDSREGQGVTPLIYVLWRSKLLLWLHCHGVP